VSKLRLASIRYPKDPDTRRLLDDLSQSADFRALWDDTDPGFSPPRHLVKTTVHPRAGWLEFDCALLYVPEDDHEVFVLSAKPGSVSAARLRSLPPITRED
jgi:hypothetical protein